MSELYKLSNDIKSLEAYLDRSAVRIDSEVRLPGDCWGNENGPGEYLSWTKGEPDRWRVIYFRTGQITRTAS